MGRKIRRPGFVPEHHDEGHSPLGGRLRDIQVGMGLPPCEELEEELEGYRDVLMGRTPPPIDVGVLTLMEVANAYYSRAAEIEQLILEAERKGAVFKGHTYYRFRTGELRSFLELTKRAAELGSRRLTQAKLLHDMAQEAEGLYYGEP